MPTCRAIWRSKWQRPARRLAFRADFRTRWPPNRVEWSFKWDPYAGGEVRRFAHPSMSESLFGVHRPITVSARLYLGGAYLRLVSEQAIIQGGRRDPDLVDKIRRMEPTGSTVERRFRLFGPESSV